MTSLPHDRGSSRGEGSHKRNLPVVKEEEARITAERRSQKTNEWLERAPLVASMKELLSGRSQGMAARERLGKRQASKRWARGFRIRAIRFIVRAPR